MFMKFVCFILDTVKILFRLLPDCAFTQRLVFKWFKYFMKFMAFVELFLPLIEIARPDRGKENSPPMGKAPSAMNPAAGLAIDSVEGTGALAARRSDAAL